MQFFHRRHALPPGSAQWLHAVSGGLAQGPTMLCLHGATGNWTNYRPLMKHFADYRIEAPEMRGHGRTPWAGPCSLDELYYDLEHFAERLPKPMLTLAHSFGGYFGLRLAATHPDWVSHLVLFNTAHTIPRGLPFKSLRWTTPLCNRIASPEGLIATNSLVTEYLMDVLLPHWDCRPLYPRLQCPVLVVAGGLDPLIPINLALASADLMPVSRVRVLPVGGHVAMWERPALLNHWIRDFLTAFPPGAPGRPTSTAPN